MPDRDQLLERKERTGPPADWRGALLAQRHQRSGAADFSISLGGGLQTAELGGKIRGGGQVPTTTPFLLALADALLNFQDFHRRQSIGGGGC